MVFAQIPPEELVFRGHVQHLLGFRLSRVTVILVQSALFAGAVSLVVGSTDAFLDLVLLGVLAGLSRATTGGTWAGVGVRLALTATAIVLHGVDVSFGADSGVWNPGVNVGGALTACLAVRFLLAARSEPTRPPAEQDTLPRRRSPVRGIMYDVGSGYVPGQNSRERWNPSFGIVRPPSLGSALSPDDGHREPKEGFHALARRYGADVPTTADQDRGFSRAVHA